MKTLHDYLKAICEGDYTSPVITVPVSIFEPVRLTTCGRMVCISVDMLFGGEY